MSGTITTGVNTDLGSSSPYSGPVMFQTRRNINGIIIPDCTIEEVGEDELVLTEHPVEQGSTITDHAFKRPRLVTLRWGWTNSNLSGILVTDVYNQILALQAERTPLAISTGKQVYSSMQFVRIQQTTDDRSENALMLVIICREVIIVQTQVTTVAPQSAQADPSKTSPVANSGSQSAQEASIPTPPIPPTTPPAAVASTSPVAAFNDMGAFLGVTF